MSKDFGQGVKINAKANQYTNVRTQKIVDRVQQALAADSIERLGRLKICQVIRRDDVAALVSEDRG